MVGKKAKASGSISSALTKRRTHPAAVHASGEKSKLVIITGVSGSGKVSALKVFEDLGYYCVDNLPMDLVTSFAELLVESREPTDSAMVVDIREGTRLDRLPGIVKQLKKRLDTTLIFLDAADNVLLRRFSETRRPHPLGKESSVERSIASERHRMEPIRNIADILLDTTNFNVHELRDHLVAAFEKGSPTHKSVLISILSFGFKNGIPQGADLVFDVRFLPNPHFVPEFRPLTGRHPQVAKYIRSFPQTQEFIQRVADLLIYLIPHYIEEGKSYLTIAFGCTGGQHRSVMIAEEVKKRLAKAGFRTKVDHRDSPR
jgi:UPF0042 nucleotide-binding protein